MYLRNRSAQETGFFRTLPIRAVGVERSSLYPPPQPEWAHVACTPQGRSGLTEMPSSYFPALTQKEAEFVEAILDGCTRTEAARRSGYGTTLGSQRVQGSRLMHRPKTVPLPGYYEPCPRPVPPGPGPIRFRTGSGTEKC